MSAVPAVREIGEKVERGGRITAADARVLWEQASDEELRRLAGLVRARYHEPDRATYLVMRIINYTNVCVAQCDYCAFYVLPNQAGGYVLTREDVFAKIDALIEAGGDLVGFNGGFNPKLPLHYYCDLFRAVRDRYGDRVEFYALTIAELMYLADRAGLSYADTTVYIDAGNAGWHAPVTMAPRLRDAGMQTADGFALNVSNFFDTSESIRYGAELSGLAGGKHFVIDTSRNGSGPSTPYEWCNPMGRSVGASPTTNTGHPLVDAYLWVKPPGESDGECNGGPGAGKWWPEYALGLAQRSSL